MPNSGYFDSQREKAIIEGGGFFCEACCIGKPSGEQSPDERYCLACYEFLLKEAELDTSRRTASWKPVIPHKQGDKKVKGAAQVSEDIRVIMSTVKGKKSEVNIIHPAVTARPVAKRGPKHRDLPDDLIIQWGGEGMGSKGIAARLAKEYNVTVSYKTIQRLLSGQRVLV